MTDMSQRGRGSSSYRGRGGRGKTAEIISQHGKTKLVAMNLSQDAEYQAFLEYKRSQTPTQEENTSSYAKIISDDDLDSNNIGFSTNQHKEIIFLLEEKDLKWKDNPWILLQRYLDNASMPTRTYKSRQFYEQILIQNGSCDISHFTGTNKEIYNFSKMIIKRVISVEDWGISPMKDREIVINKSAQVKYNYWDYCDAFVKVLQYENDRHKHTWFIKICAHVYQEEIPHWFVNWFYCYGPVPGILPEEFKILFDKWVDISPQLIKKQKSQIFIEGIASCFFFAEFSIPWIWKWTPEMDYTPTGIPCVYRISHTKFWEKMIKIDPVTKVQFGQETLDHIRSQVEIYQNQQEKLQAPSPFDHISRKFKMRSEILSKEQMIQAYLEEMKKDLLSQFEEEKSNKSTKSDNTDYMQDSQDPEDINIDDIFGAIQDTLMGKMNQGASSSSKKAD